MRTVEELKMVVVRFLAGSNKPVCMHKVCNIKILHAIYLAQITELDHCYQLLVETIG